MATKDGAFSVAVPHLQNMGMNDSIITIFLTPNQNTHILFTNVCILVTVSSHTCIFVRIVLVGELHHTKSRELPILKHSSGSVRVLARDCEL